jgi:hypothetical protein
MHMFTLGLLLCSLVSILVFLDMFLFLKKICGTKYVLLACQHVSVLILCLLFSLLNMNT